MHAAKILKDQHAKELKCRARDALCKYEIAESLTSTLRFEEFRLKFLFDHIDRISLIEIKYLSY